eukprot:4772902-Amphidinium_carterae.1
MVYFKEPSTPQSWWSATPTAHDIPARRVEVPVVLKLQQVKATVDNSAAHMCMSSEQVGELKNIINQRQSKIQQIIIMCAHKAELKGQGISWTICCKKLNIEQRSQAVPHFTSILYMVKRAHQVVHNDEVQAPAARTMPKLIIQQTLAHRYLTSAIKQ